MDYRRFTESYGHFGPDTQKLIRVNAWLCERQGIRAEREPIMLFDRHTGRLLRWTHSVSERDFRAHIVHVPDLWVPEMPPGYRDRRMVIEVDGWIHALKDRVRRKDSFRNACYRGAGIPMIIISESMELERQGVGERRAATAEEVYTALSRKLALRRQGSGGAPSP